MFKCDSCGDVEEGVMAGYEIGGSTLEGVDFKVKKNDDGTLDVRAVDDWDTDPYLCGLNKDHWMKKVKEFAEDGDCIYCPNCNDVLDWI